MTTDNSGVLVSVYMPTHNRADLACRAIRSVIGQSYTNIELIVCDDGSDWDSYVPVREALSENGAIYVRNEKPLGACAARNRAILRASGELITGLDDDDEFSSDHIHNLINHYDDNYSFVASSYLSVTTRNVKSRRYDVGVISLNAQLHYNRVGNQVLTRTCRLKQVGLFDEAMPAMQDHDMWIRLLRDFGPGLKLRDCTYIQHLEHDHGRISERLDKLEFAYALLLKKYRCHMTRTHLESSKIMQSKLKGRKLNVSELYKFTNRSNYRWSLSLYFKYVRAAVFHYFRKIIVK